MSAPTVRAFRRADLEAAEAAWRAGRFSPEWVPWRRVAAELAGIIYPPEGTEWDQWDEPAPSQRAILIRAIRETPGALRAAIAASGVRSWGDVIERLLSQRDTMRDETSERLDAEAAAWAEAKAAERAEAGQALTRIDAVLLARRDLTGAAQ
ncbi:hypothetical protein BH23CHL8_BH23CHL8_26280 [soil metagenome]